MSCQTTYLLSFIIIIIIIKHTLSSLLLGQHGGIRVILLSLHVDPLVVLSHRGLTILLGGGLGQHILYGIVPSDASELCGILCALEEATEEIQQSYNQSTNQPMHMRLGDRDTMQTLSRACMDGGSSIFSSNTATHLLIYLPTYDHIEHCDRSSPELGLLAQDVEDHFTLVDLAAGMDQY